MIDDFLLWLNMCEWCERKFQGVAGRNETILRSEMGNKGREQAIKDIGFNYKT